MCKKIIERFLLLSFFVGNAISLFAGSNAQFISQQFIPTSILTGASATVTITMLNNGTTTWSSAGPNQFSLGYSFPGLPWGTGRASLPSATIPPGQQATFIFKIIAPDSVGLYNFQWQMLQENIEWFGASTPLVQIQVNQSNNSFDKTQIDGSNFGTYFWSGYNALNNPGPNFLSTGSSMAENIGTSVIRIFMSPQSDISYHLNNNSCIQNFTLKSLAQRADFNKILSNPQFKVIMITAFDGATNPNCQSKYLTPGFYNTLTIQQIENEYQDFAQYLGATFPDKTFIIAHWEGDNAVYTTSCINSDSCHARIGAFTQWINARTAGIHAAGMNNVFSCMEFNYRNGFDPGPLTLLHDALPNINADYFSYSSWGSSFTVSTNEADEFKSDIHAIRKIMAATGKDSTKLIIGEFGFNSPTRELSKDRHVVLAQAIYDLKIPYAIIWQLLDVDGAQISPFGLYDTTATITLTGQAYCNLWGGSVCGNINDAGITALISPVSSSCPGNISPQITLKNFGNYELDAIKISYQLDNNPVIASQFAVSYGNGLSAGNTISLTLNPSVFSSGVHQLKIFSSLPNSKNDAVNSNDTLVANINLNCTTGVEENNSELSLQVFPNPSSDKIHIVCQMKKEEAFKVELINSVGQIVNQETYQMQYAGINTFIMDVSKFSAGIYCLIATSGNMNISKRIEIVK